MKNLTCCARWQINDFTFLRDYDKVRYVEMFWVSVQTRDKQIIICTSLQKDGEKSNKISKLMEWM